MLTIDQAVKQLNLVPFAEFVPPRNAPEGRATGQTTQMLLEAVIHSQSEPVSIRGFNYAYTQVLIKEAKAMAAQLGLDPNNIGTKGLAFVDHYRPLRSTKK